MRKESTCHRIRRTKRRVLKTKIYNFYAVSDGESRVYTQKDGQKGYGPQLIPSPSTISIVQVFVNGVLQPRELYRIRKGRIKLVSTDIPIKGVPILVQSIRILA